MTVTFNGNSSVVVETGKNITMQWIINLTGRSSIDSVQIYAQLRLNEKTRILSWVDGKHVLSTHGEKIYGNRLITDLTDSKFALKITNVQYNDTGNYSMRVVSSPPLLEAEDTASVYVYGKRFCCFKGSIFFGKLSESQSLR